MNQSIVGKYVPRVDALDKVLGRAKYADDIWFEGMLYAKVLRSKHPHARILKVDTSKAVQLEGVVAILTARDVPVNTFGIQTKDQVVLAEDRVRYMGDPVAVVAAETEEIADEATELIDVQYEILPSVFDQREALKQDAPKVHARGNLAAHRKIRKGNVEDGFAESDEIVEDTFSTQKSEHCHIEPHAGVAVVDSLGKVTVWAGSSLPNVAQAELARVLGLPMSKVRIVQPEIGGNFGGRNEISIEPYICLIAMKTKRPVKLVRTREEEFIASTIRHSYFLRYKTGVKKDGTLIAREIEIISDAGAYSSYGESSLTKSCILAAGPYRIPNVKVDGYLVFTNNPVGGAMRGFGAPQVHVAEETHMDNIASRLSIDPLELRVKNALKNGDTTVTGQVLHSVGLTETIERASEAFGWHKELGEKAVRESKVRGKGVSCAIYPIGLTEKPNPSGAFVKCNVDGTINVIVGAVEVGQGSKTALSQIAAEEFGVELDKVNLTTGDTDVSPYDFGCVASRTTYTTGKAIQIAANSARSILFNTVAQELAVSPDALEMKNGKICVKGSPSKGVSIAEAVQLCYRRGMLVLGSGYFNPPNNLLDPETGRGSPYPSYVYATQMAEVEVDVECGLVKVLRIVAAHDTGRAINPVLVKGQIFGGAALGVGEALTESLVIEEGRTCNPNFFDYLITSIEDMPDVEAIIVEELEPTGPLGAKGFAEATNVPTAAAIINAICDATGAKIRTLPANPARVLQALKERKALHEN